MNRDEVKTAVNQYAYDNAGHGEITGPAGNSFFKTFAEKCRWYDQQPGLSYEFAMFSNADLNVSDKYSYGFVHNLDTAYPDVTVYDDQGYELDPDLVDIQKVDSNLVKIYLHGAISGNYLVFCVKHSFQIIIPPEPVILFNDNMENFTPVNDKVSLPPKFTYNEINWSNGLTPLIFEDDGDMGVDLDGALNFFLTRTHNFNFSAGDKLILSITFRDVIPLVDDSALSFMPFTWDGDAGYGFGAAVEINDQTVVFHFDENRNLSCTGILFLIKDPGPFYISNMKLERL